MKRIEITFIPHNKQRYDTCGDWQFAEENQSVSSASLDSRENFSAKGGDVLKIFVSETADWRSSALVAVHELIEALYCKYAGVTTEQVDQFDLNWKPHGRFTEPGEDPEAPYFHQHALASAIEIDLCSYFGLQWQQHELNLGSLSTSND